MKKVILFLLLSVVLNAQYITPGLGNRYTIQNLVSTSNGTVIQEDGSTFRIKSNLTISANDSLITNINNTLIKIDPNVSITIVGYFESNAPGIEYTSSDINQHYLGVILESEAKGFIKNTKFSYGGGVRSKTGNIIIDNCFFYKNKSGINSKAAFELVINSTGQNVYPTVTNSTFSENNYSGFYSKISSRLGYLQFNNNIVSKNGRSAEAQVEIIDESYILEIGPPPVLDTIRIMNNQILGNRNLNDVGGINIETRKVPINFSGNTIKDNSFGVTFNTKFSSNIKSTNYIFNNIIEQNNTGHIQQGWGISIVGPGVGPSSHSRNSIYKNQIRNNFRGIYSSMNAKLDLGGGETNSPGRNVFSENIVNGKTIAFEFGYKSVSVTAKYNCWREGEISTDQMVYDVILFTYPISNDLYASAMQMVTPYDCGVVPLATANYQLNNKTVYPIPNEGLFYINSPDDDRLSIYNMTGQKIAEQKILKGINKIHIHVAPGSYILTFLNSLQNAKIIIK